MGMAAEVVAGLEQGDLGRRHQGPGGAEARDAGADDGDAAHQARLPAATVMNKAAVQRPEANEGGREEEERRFGIAARRTGWLHGMKSFGSACADRAHHHGSPRHRAPNLVTPALRWSSVHDMSGCRRGIMEN
jgi:hypothetical protein